MLYHLFTTLREIYDLPGAGLFSYVSFRAGMSLMTSLVVGILFGKRIIERLQLKQVGEIVRDLGLEGQMNKQGTPTMGGLIILGAILVPTLLFADLTNVYTQLMILATVWLGTIGFIDDYIKVFKKNKDVFLLVLRTLQILFRGDLEQTPSRMHGHFGLRAPQGP